MKKSIIKQMLAVTFISAALVLTTNCGGNETSEHSHNHEEGHKYSGDKPVEDIVYACPMHPEITGGKGEQCPKCGMDLEILE